MNAMLKMLKEYRGALVFLFCMFAFRSAIADWNVVPTGSMQPTIRIGDRILVDKAAYDIRLPFTHVSLLHLADPQRGDVVVIDSRAAGERLVKRVIGVPGDEVALRANRLYVNGQPARYVATAQSGIADDRRDPAHYEIESYQGMRHAMRLSLQAPSPASSFGPVRVPAGKYLLLGDDRDNSEDSRYLGYFPRREIVGRSRYVVMSLDPRRYYLPRKDRFGAALDR